MDIFSERIMLLAFLIPIPILNAEDNIAKILDAKVNKFLQCSVQIYQRNVHAFCIHQNGDFQMKAIIAEYQDNEEQR